MLSKTIIKKWQLGMALTALMATVGTFQACSNHSFSGDSQPAAKVDAQGGVDLPVDPTVPGPIAGPIDPPSVPTHLDDHHQPVDPTASPTPHTDMDDHDMDDHDHHDADHHDVDHDPQKMPSPTPMPTPQASPSPMPSPVPTLDPMPSPTPVVDSDCLDIEKVPQVDRKKVVTQGKGKGEEAHVQICHVPPGNPAKAHTLVIGESAVSAHLSHHDDYLGACGQPVVPSCK
jgi:hypothetical protein